MAITYRDEKGSDLTAEEIDDNFHALEDAVADLVENAIPGVGVASVTRTGTTLIFHLTNGADLDPISIPTLRTRYMGDFQGSFPYEEQDTFKVNGVGVFWVLVDHTSAAEFDPAALDDDDNPLYFQLFGVSTLTGLGELVDVELTDPADGDVLKYVAADEKWENVPLESIGALLDGIGTTQGQILYRGVSAWSVLSPGTSGRFLKTLGSGADPAWSDLPALPTLAAGRLLGNGTGSPAAAVETTLTALIDQALGNTRGSVLYRGSSGWAILTPGTSGKVLQANGAGADPTWETPAGGGGGLALDDLTDATITTPSDGDVLTFDSGTSEWVNLPPSGGGGGGGALDDLSDVDTSGVTTGDVLTFDGSDWVPEAPSGGGGVGIGLFPGLITAVPTFSNTGLSTNLNIGSSNIVEGDTGITIKALGAVGQNVIGRYGAAPTPPYRVRGLFSFTAKSVDFSVAGMSFYDGTNKIQGVEFIYSSGWRLRYAMYPNPTTTATEGGTQGGGGPVSLIWFMLSDDGTNFSTGYGMNGEDFIIMQSGTKSGGYLGSSGYSNIMMHTNMITSGNDGFLTLHGLVVD